MSAFGFLRRFDTPPVGDDERKARVERTRDAIVSVLSPRFVFVFGSAASGAGFDASSDIDCLVVLENRGLAARSWKMFGKIRKQLSWPVDIVCLSIEEFERKKNIGGIAFVATHEGQLIYSSRNIS